MTRRSWKLRSRHRPAELARSSAGEKLPPYRHHWQSRVILAGSARAKLQEWASIPPAVTQSMAQSLASVAEPPFPKIISLPPRRMRSEYCARGIADLFCFLARHLRSQLCIISSATFIRIELATLAPHPRCVVSRDRGMDRGIPLRRRRAQLTVFKEDVHCFPKGVIEDFDQLLLDEWIGVCRRNLSFNLRAQETRRSSLYARARYQGRPKFRDPLRAVESITMSSERTIASSHAPKEDRKIKCGQRAFTYNHGMNESDRHVLRVCWQGRWPKRQQAAAAAKKAVGHLTTSFRESISLRAKKDSEIGCAPKGAVQSA